MTTITIPQHAIRAVSFAMAKKDERYCLLGMLLEHNGAETRLVATDGHRLNACLIEHQRALITEPISVIIPRAMIEKIIKAKAPRNQKTEAQVTISFADVQHGIGDDGKPTVTMPVKASALLPDGSETVNALINGRYPDYHRVIPESFSGEPAHYNLSYMVDADSAMLAWLNLGNGKSHGHGFGYNGTSAGGYSVPGFVAIVMPMRADMCSYTDIRLKTEMAKPEAQVRADTDAVTRGVNHD